MKPEELLESNLRNLARKYRQARRFTNLNIAGILLLIGVLFLSVILDKSDLGAGQFFVLAIAGFSAVAFLIYRQSAQVDQNQKELIELIENGNEDLKERLYTAMEFKEKNKETNVFERALINEVIEHNFKHKW